MGVEPAAANRSLGTIRTELEFLRDSGLLNPAQFQSIMSQLPVRISSPRLPLPPSRTSLTNPTSRPLQPAAPSHLLQTNPITETDKA